MLEELNIEKLERISHVATFAKVELVLGFMSGHSGRGAIVIKFLNAIHIHNQLVHEVEECWVQVDSLQKLHNKTNKLFRNMDSFFYVSNKDPADLSAFEEMIPRMRVINERLKQITDKEVKSAVVAEYRSFKRKEIKYDRLLRLRQQLDKIRTVRDAYQHQLVEAQLALSECRKKEEAASNKALSSSKMILRQIS
jgi:chaperonin cofactor prefoldin